VLEKHSSTRTVAEELSIRMLSSSIWRLYLRGVRFGKDEAELGGTIYKHVTEVMVLVKCLFKNELNCPLFLEVNVTRITDTHQSGVSAFTSFWKEAKIKELFHPNNCFYCFMFVNLWSNTVILGGT
jgi:hypothetical protein